MANIITKLSSSVLVIRHSLLVHLHTKVVCRRGTITAMGMTISHMYEAVQQASSSVNLLEFCFNNGKCGSCDTGVRLGPSVYTCGNNIPTRRPLYIRPQALAVTWCCAIYRHSSVLCVVSEERETPQTGIALQFDIYNPYPARMRWWCIVKRYRYVHMCWWEGKKEREKTLSYTLYYTRACAILP